MHSVLGDSLHRHRKKGAGTDMKRHLGKPDTGCNKRVHQARREMKPGCRRRNGAGLGSEHRLVILGIKAGTAVGTADIGWQRHAAILCQPGLERLRTKRLALRRVDEFQMHLAAIAALNHPCREIRTEDDHVTGAAFARRLGENAPACAIFMLVKRDPDAGLAAAAGKPGRNHPRVVDHKQVTGPQKRWQVADPPVGHALAAEIQQPCRIPWARRRVGNRLWRQFIIEIGEFHR